MKYYSIITHPWSPGDPVCLRTNDRFAPENMVLKDTAPYIEQDKPNIEFDMSKSFNKPELDLESDKDRLPLLKKSMFDDDF
ncbi:MAG: hypothetical protein R6U32_07730 [Candidatus Woesearchaeota archaeon]